MLTGKCWYFRDSLVSVLGELRFQWLHWVTLNIVAFTSFDDLERV
jgi:hypothetical protein